MLYLVSEIPIDLNKYNFKKIIEFDYIDNRNVSLHLKKNRSAVYNRNN